MLSEAVFILSHPNAAKQMSYAKLINVLHSFSCSVSGYERAGWSDQPYEPFQQKEQETGDADT
jgi:hypothetical protein